MKGCHRVSGGNDGLAPIWRICLFAVFACTLGCASRVPDYHGRWKPVNRFSSHPQEIPLRPAYVFMATPKDQTLKNLLARWARDNRMSLAYHSDLDFTLHQAVSEIRALNLQDALDQLNKAYAMQNISISVDAGSITARRVPATARAEGAR